MAPPIQQGYAQFSLELFDRLADRGLGGEHHFGGLGKAALAHNFDESANGSKIHKDSISEYYPVDKFIFVMPGCGLGSRMETQLDYLFTWSA